MKRRFLRVARTVRFAVASKVERQYAKARRRQRSRLFLPTLLIEPATVGQPDRSVTFSVNVRVDYASVLGRKRHSLLPRGIRRKQQRHNDGNKQSDCIQRSKWIQQVHAANVPLLSANVHFA